MGLSDNYKYEKVEVLNYFDQFSEYEIDLTEYLQRFSTPENPITFSNMQPVKLPIKNLFAKIDVTVDLKNNPSDFESYVLKEGDTPVTLSFQKYGLIDFWWVIFAFNKIENYYTQWPLTHEEVIKLVDLQYQNEHKYNRDTYYNLIFEANEKKRNILLPEISVIVKTLTEYSRLIQIGQ